MEEPVGDVLELGVERAGQEHGYALREVGEEGHGADQTGCGAEEENAGDTFGWEESEEFLTDHTAHTDTGDIEVSEVA